MTDWKAHPGGVEERRVISECEASEQVKSRFFGIEDLEASWRWYYSRRVWNNHNKESTPPLSWFCLRPGDSLLNEIFLLHWGQTADSIRKMIMCYLLLSLRALGHVLSIELNNLLFRKESELLSWGWNLDVMVILNSSRAKQQRKMFHQFMSISHVWESRSMKQIISTDRPPRTSCHGSIRETVCLTCFPVSSLADSGLSGTWHNKVWHRVRLSRVVPIWDRGFLGLLIWALTLLELRYHTTGWQPGERLFFLSFLMFLWNINTQKTVFTWIWA